jgi:GTPase SAR1 family protein
MIDYDKWFREIAGEPKVNSNHAPFFPSSIRCVIAGRSGSGKTNLMFKFIMNREIDCDDAYIYSKSINQSIYKNFRKLYNALKSEFKDRVTTFHFFDSDKDTDIINPSEQDPNKKHLMIFDDIVDKKQVEIVQKYFRLGRHNNANCFYLHQSFHEVDKHGIRDNANMFILFEHCRKTLRHIHDDYISTDMELNEFESFCKEAWSQKHGFIVINLWEDPKCGRYVSNYKVIYTPKKYI